MQKFTATGPVEAVIDLVVGDLLVTTGDGSDVVVEVLPRSPGRTSDVRAVDRTDIDYRSGRLTVRTPKPRGIVHLGNPGAIDVRVELPTGSRLDFRTSVGSVHGIGALADCTAKTSTGDIELSRTGPAILSTSVGDITVDRIDGTAELTLGSGRLRIAELAGSAKVRNSNGASWFGRADDDLVVKAASGDITVGRAGGRVTLATPLGGLAIGSLEGGPASLSTSSGSIRVGIPVGTAARLDARTSFGKVITELAVSDGPAAADRTTEVFARTKLGDIIIHRPTAD